MRRPTNEERWPRPAVMGIVNVTPDSFSDGGSYASAEAPSKPAGGCSPKGRRIVDVGGESTRPGAEPVSVDEELRRVVPVLERLAGLPVSIDTSRAEVARRAIALGATMVNDVTALRRDPELAGVVADAGVDVCLMHMQGDPATMQDAPRYDDVVDEVAAFLEERLEVAVTEGIDEERIWLDPGIGFGKTADQNLELLRRLDRIVALGRPVLVGLSRKSTLARILGGPDAGSAPTRPRSAPRSRRSTAARRCFACTTCARTSRRSRRRLRSSGVGSRDDDRAARASSSAAFHGVLEHERPEGQRFLVDLELDARGQTAATSDRIEDAVDYRDVVAAVVEVSEARAYHLLEALATALADALLAAFPLARVRVRVRKPDVVLARPVDHAAVVVERAAGLDAP